MATKMPTAPSRWAGTHRLGLTPGPVRAAAPPPSWHSPTPSVLPHTVERLVVARRRAAVMAVQPGALAVLRQAPRRAETLLPVGDTGFALSDAVRDAVRDALHAVSVPMPAPVPDDLGVGDCEGVPMRGGTCNGSGRPT